MSSTGYKLVYIRGGAYYYVDLERKYDWLSRISDGEPAMLRALGKFKGNASGELPGSMLALVKDWEEKVLPTYAETKRADYKLMPRHLEAALRDVMVAAVTSHHIMDVRDQWADKPARRTSTRRCYRC
jgi:hypothetical protein